MKTYNMPPHIVEHSKMVYHVALTLASLLKKEGCDINTPLIEAGALLHDITKSKAIKTGENHSETGAELLATLGYPEVASIVSQHVKIHQPGNTRNPVSEAEIVNYADKRVMHDHFVSLGQRFRDIRERYGKTKERLERIKETEIQVQAIEYKIFSILPMTSEDLEKYVHETN